MQTNNTELNNSQDYNKHLYIKDDDGINFRPSPNFKHMKKYLKSKFEESACNSPSAVEQESDTIATVEEPERGPAGRAGALQPPLPPHPPPPDSPVTAFKQEAPDDDYESPEGANPAAPPPDRVMCRQFARGICTRGDSCIYAHEVILSQLKDVYTFCKNFQNPSGCNLPKCKFVHATVFEKESYFRTGYLPPHALAHTKEPTPPTSQKTEGVGSSNKPDPIKMFSNPPPPIVVPKYFKPDMPPPALPPPALTPRATAPPAPPAAAPTPLKRDHNELLPDAVLGEPPVKKCKACDIVQFKIRCAKQKFDDVLAGTAELDKKNAAITAKLKKMYDVYSSIAKIIPPILANGGVVNNSNANPMPSSSAMSTRAEKEINGVGVPLNMPIGPNLRFGPNYLNQSNDEAIKLLCSLGLSPAVLRLLLNPQPPPDPRL